MAQDARSPLPTPVNIGDIVDKYRVEHVVGVGAMGLVVAARHTTLEQIVAIKFLVEHRFGSRDESIARFLGEARAAARIQSDHVCRVSDVGMLPSGVPYMIMEHLEGNDLEDEIVARGQLDLVEAVDYVLQACDAIAAAHQLGVVHRDLKPANLFLARRPDGSRRVKVLDFGISKATTGKQRFTRETRSLGTPAYMPPEQVRDPMNVDHRADIWALGAILYEVLTGQMAFVGENIKEVLDRVLGEDPCPMPALRRDVPPELTAIVTRALARDRDARWPTAATFARALAPFGSIGVLSGLASIQREVGSLSSISALRASLSHPAPMAPSPLGSGAYAAHAAPMAPSPVGSGAYAAYATPLAPSPVGSGAYRALGPGMLGPAGSGQYPAYGPAPSVDGVTSSLPREMPTQPDPSELSRRHSVVQDWTALQTRRRRARAALLVMFSALLVAGTAAVLVYRVARPRPPRVDGQAGAASVQALSSSTHSPPPAATALAPAEDAPQASAAPATMQSAPISVHPASSSVRPTRNPRPKAPRR
ncbi:MAG: serine/threonine protein kinase [Labilithrix sp.]|nr:serine/threonine protein kinase [Labilithrix sp.]